MRHGGRRDAGQAGHVLDVHALASIVHTVSDSLVRRGSSVYHGERRLQNVLANASGGSQHEPDGGEDSGQLDEAGAARRRARARRWRGGVGAGGQTGAASGVGAASASPRRRRRHAAHRLDGRPRQPEPLHRGRDGDRRGAVPHLRPALRVRPRRQAHPAARDRAADEGERRHLRRRPHVDGPHPARREVAGRAAAHRRRRRLHLQPDHRQQADLVPAGGQGHQARRGGRRHHGALHHVRPQGGHALRGRVRPPGAHLGQGQDLDARAQLCQQAADRRQRALPGDVLQARRLHQAGAQPRLLGQRRAGLGAAQGRRDHLPGLHEPRHDGPGPAHRRGRRGAGRALGAVLRPAGRARDQGDRLQLLQLGLRRLQLLRQPGVGRQPGAPRPGVPRGARLRDRPRADRPARVQRPRQARLHDDQRRHVARPRLPLAAARRRRAPVRPRQGQGTAGRRGLQGHGRRRHPRGQEGQAHLAAPVGAGRVDLDPGRGQAPRRVVRGHRPQDPASRSWTTAWPATRCTPGRATRRRRTTT